MDGLDLGWKSSGNNDRFFFTYESSEPLSKGSHELLFQLRNNSYNSTIIRQLCNVDLHEYAGEQKFRKLNDTFIGAYPTFNNYGFKTYRPSNERCLMRNMTSHHFCDVCKECLWTELMARISLIDKLERVCGSDFTTINLSLLKLGIFREQVVEGLIESYEIKWIRNGVEAAEFRNMLNVTISKQHSGEWVVFVKLYSSQVRVDWHNVLEARKTFSTCSH